MAQVATRRMYTRPWTPRADIYETQESVVVQLDLPGVQADQVDVQCEKGMLSIKGDRQIVQEEGRRLPWKPGDVYAHSKCQESGGVQINKLILGQHEICLPTRPQPSAVVGWCRRVWVRVRVPAADPDRAG